MSARRVVAMAAIIGEPHAGRQTIKRRLHPGSARNFAPRLRVGVGSAYVDRVIPNRSIPAATVIPVLVYPDVRAAVAWLTEVFGFAERVRIGEDHRSQMRIGTDGAVIVADVRGEKQPPRAGAVTHVIKVRVADVDAQFERVRRHGARVLQEPTEYPYGEREFTVEDLAGHRWQFTQTLRDTAPEDWGGVTVNP
jgi:uncharacterized glyoxalase superfamily protein PhnB